MSEFYKQLVCEENTQYSVVVEDDSKVAYAYLFKGSEVIGDVWLYNQASTPLIAKWDKKNLPFLNPNEFVKEHISPIVNDSEVTVVWYFTYVGEFESVLIYIHGKLTAKLSIGSMPGWSRCVLKDGPLGLELKIEN